MVRLELRRLHLPIALLGLTVLMLACHQLDTSSAQASTGDDPPAVLDGSVPAPFTLATFNVNFGNPDLDAVVESIRQADADLVVLQETNRTSARHLADALGDVYPFMDFKHHRRAGGLGYLSRVELDEAPRYIDAEHGWFGAWVIEVQLGGVDLAIANVHLQPTLPERGDSASDMFWRFLELERVRVDEITDIVAELPADAVRIVAGDLNTIPGMTTLGWLRDAGFTDTFAAVHDDANAHPTWHWEHGDSRWTFRLDYILAELDAIAPVDSRVIVDDDASDHYLVVTRFAPATAPQAINP